MSAHAKLSPSSSSRWLTCTASIEACEGYDDFGNKASKWGSACHFLGESILLGAPLPAIGEHIETVEVDTRMFTLAEEYVDYVRGIQGKNGRLLVEERFDLSFIAPNTFGTSDSTILSADGHLHVIDLKTGTGIVGADDNTQLMLYALGALEHFKNKFIEEVTLHIVQTSVNHISSWTVSVQELMEFRAHAQTQANRILTGDTSFVPDTKACQWCKHKANCEALAQHVEDVITGEFEALEDIDGKVDDIKPTHIEKILANESLITSFIKAVKDKALEDMQSGKSYDGFKLVRSSKHKRWTDTEGVENYLVRKLKKTGAYKQTLITPTQAIKLLGKENAKYIEKFIEVPEGDIMIAPSTDKRQAVQAICEEFDDLS